MELVGKLRFLNESGGLETINPWHRAEVLAVAAVGASVTGVVLIVSFLGIFFIFT